jgi:hypothetical protein
MSESTSPAPWRRPDLLRLSYDDYRALPAIANSDLSRLRDALNGRPRRESSGSSALSFGTAFHTALLEPDQYVPSYPAVNDSLVWWLVEGVRLRDDLRELLDQGVAEPSCIFTEPITGTMCKLRADLVVDVPGQPYTVIDFKTTLARDYHHFVAQCSGYDYDRQAAFYLDALRADRFILVGVQKQPPHHLFVFEVPPHMLEEGRAKYLRLLRLLDPTKLPDYLDPAVRDVVLDLGHTPPEQEDDPAPPAEE